MPVASSLDPSLLEILVCPATKQKVHEAGEDVLGRLREAQKSGTLKNAAGEKVEQLIEAGLVREDGAVLYPIFDQIPVMLEDQAIPLEQGG